MSRGIMDDDVEAIDAPLVDEERSLPIGVGERSEALDLAAAAPRRRLGFGTLVLAATACVAGASLWSMRLVGGASADAAPTEAGRLVESFLKERGGRADEKSGARTDLLDADSYAALQISADELVKNPFSIASTAEPALAPSGLDDPTLPTSSDSPLGGGEVDPSADALAAWNALVESGILELRVQSAMVSSRPAQSLATINGRVVRIGGAVTAPGVGVEYRLHAVEIGAVVVEARDESLGAERLLRIDVSSGN